MSEKILAVFMVIAATAVLNNFAVAAEPEKMDIPGIRNFTLLDDSTGIAGSTVGFGGATEPAAMARLRDEGFTTVISLRRDTEEGANIEESRAAAEAAGLNYVHLPYSPAEQDPEVVATFIAMVKETGNQSVYLHCGSATRAAVLWMISRVLEDGLTMDAAAAEARGIAADPDRAVEVATEYISSR